MTSHTRDLVLAVLASARADATVAPMLHAAEMRLGLTVEDALALATAMDLEEPLREIVQRNGARDLLAMFEAASLAGAAAMDALRPPRRRAVESIASHLWDAAVRLRAEYIPAT